MRTSTSIIAALVPLALAAGPCDVDACAEVTGSEGVFCWMPIVLGWEGANQDPKGVFDCVSSPDIMCNCYGCESGLEKLITDNSLCPVPSGSA
ncbi:hypothetical protein F4677DRAFT_436331 [Hypoxylon crocopeplum]|nr:hypothetical protein F4677DRAFT_436331 [Hypoxylon crocopeplum]